MKDKIIISILVVFLLSLGGYAVFFKTTGTYCQWECEDLDAEYIDWYPECVCEKRNGERFRPNWNRPGE